MYGCIGVWCVSTVEAVVIGTCVSWPHYRAVNGDRTCCCDVISVKNELSPISSSGALQSNGVLHCISPVLLRAVPYCLPACPLLHQCTAPWGPGGKLKGIKIQVCRGERERSWRNRVGEKEKLTGLFSQREGGGRELAQKGRGEG